MNNLENNKLIAEFMGKKNAEELQYSHTNQHGVNVYQSIHRYDTDWDWLMAVVDKIESLGYWINRINGDIWIVDNNDKTIINNTLHQGGKEAIYNACVEFIKWYNLNNN